MMYSTSMEIAEHLISLSSKLEHFGMEQLYDTSNNNFSSEFTFVLKIHINQYSRGLSAIYIPELLKQWGDFQFHESDSFPTYHDFKQSNTYWIKIFQLSSLFLTVKVFL